MYKRTNSLTYVSVMIKARITFKIQLLLLAKLFSYQQYVYIYIYLFKYCKYFKYDTSIRTLGINVPTNGLAPSSAKLNAGANLNTYLVAITS